jgi:hypothetical protein
MACNCMNLAQAGQAAIYIRCLRDALGVTPGTGWDAEAHTALYEVCSRNVDVLSERREDGAAIRAVPFGSEPARTGQYALMFANWQPADSSFWSCLGVTMDQAHKQQEIASGPYWTMMGAAATYIGISESGGVSKIGGMPWWAWLLVAAGLGGAIYLAAKD